MLLAKPATDLVPQTHANTMSISAGNRPQMSPQVCVPGVPLGFGSHGSASSGAEASDTCEVCWEDQRKAHGRGMRMMLTMLKEVFKILEASWIHMSPMNLTTFTATCYDKITMFDM